MSQSINLIPQQEKQEQQKTAIVKASTVLSIVLLIAVTGVSAYYFFETKKYEDQVSSLDDEITSYRSEIEARAQVEIDARNLDKKFTILSALFNERTNYSILLNQFTSRQPLDVTINSFDVRGDVINVAGNAKSYISVSDLVNNLLSGETSLGDGIQEDYKSLFTEVKINSVTLESSSNEVKYSLTIKFIPEKLSKK